MFADVIVDISTNNVDKIFEYKCDDSMQIGMRVLVPFGRFNIEGYVLNTKENCTYDETKIKPIIKILDNYQIINSERLELVEFMRLKYHLRRVDILRLMLPPYLRNGGKEVISYNIDLNKEINDIENLISKKAKKQQEIYEYVLKNGKVAKDKLNKIFPNNVIQSMLYKGILIQEKFIKKRKPYFTKINYQKIQLNEQQTNAINFIKQFKNETILLHGVTGSGKTEIYFTLIDEELQKGKQALLLVPEISLTNQVVSLLIARFGDEVAILHSALSSGERLDEWLRILHKEARIVIGTRSAIFAPIQDLGIVIIDEEHDGSYISDTNPRYDTHEVAKFRCNYYGCNLILGSATPSIDVYYNAIKNKFKLISITKRVNEKKLPKFEIIDMKQELLNGNNDIFSTFLLNEIEKTLKKEEQVILFINRRGFASFQLCHKCGYVAKCVDCDISLVYHKEDNLLKCHFCARRYKPLDVCPMCNYTHFKQGNAGTEYVANKISERFPKNKVFRMDSDTTSMKNSYAMILEDFKKTKAAILVGTQMIAKGHDFASVRLVGILDADMTLYGADYRSTERTYELVTQVAGRAGRKNAEGLVVLQTYSPHHYVYKYAAAQNYLSYYKTEINLREVTKFPPFCIIIRILISHEEEEIAQNITRQIYDKINLLPTENIIYKGAMNSPIKKLKKKFRKQIIIRVTKEFLINDIYGIIDLIKTDANIFVEINPKNLS